jgi:hypothetical protein
LVDRTEQGKRAQPVVGDGSSAGVGEASGAEDEEGPVVIGADLWVDVRGDAGGVVSAGEDAVGLDERGLSRRIPGCLEGALEGWRELGGDREPGEGGAEPLRVGPVLARQEERQVPSVAG